MIWYNTELIIASNFITFIEKLLLLSENGSGSDMLPLNNSSCNSKWVTRFQFKVRPKGQYSVNFGRQYDLLLMTRASRKRTFVSNSILIAN
jgi:hypothetical protein